MIQVKSYVLLQLEWIHSIDLLVMTKEIRQLRNDKTPSKLNRNLKQTIGKKKTSCWKASPKSCNSVSEVMSPTSVGIDPVNWFAGDDKRDETDKKLQNFFQIEQVLKQIIVKKKNIILKLTETNQFLERSHVSYFSWNGSIQLIY